MRNEVERDLTEKYSNTFFRKNTKWFTPDQQNRRGLDDFISGMAFIQFYGVDKAITPNSLFQMYRVGKLESLEINLFKKRSTNHLWVETRDESLCFWDGKLQPFYHTCNIQTDTDTTFYI